MNEETLKQYEIIENYLFNNPVPTKVKEALKKIGDILENGEEEENHYCTTCKEHFTYENFIKHECKEKEEDPK